VGPFTLGYGPLRHGPNWVLPTSLHEEEGQERPAHLWLKGH
jgi:hypothetical protein